jgi:isoleucyl-tRNA synthetase
MVSTLLFDDETCEKLEIPNPGMPRPYKQCIVLGHVCDMDGKKESKSKGNYTPPDLVISGKMYQNVVPDSSLVSGQIGVKKELVRGLGFTRGEKLTAKGVKGELPLSVVAAKVKAKDSVHMHPDDIKSVGVDGKLELVAPFQAPGADAFRWLFYASNPPWSNTRLSLRAIREGQREFLMRLGNVHSFFSIYANIAGFDPTDKPINPPSGRHDLDRWILHEFTALNVRVVERMDALHLYEAARDIQQFVEGLSNWYVRRSRRRFWGEGDDANDALWTLYEVLVGLSKIIAPFVPFTAEAMYLSLVGGVVDGSNESVHHCLYPTPNEALLDEKLARGMAITRELSSLGLAARSKVGVRVRQPLEAVEVVLADASLQGLIGNLSELLVEELNVREVRFSENAEEFVEFTVKPNFKTLGKRLGKEMKLCASKIREMPGTDVRRAVLTGGLTISLPSGDVMLDENDIILEVHPKGDFQAAGSADAVVALSTEISDDLKEEGLSREVVNRIQGIRKELSLDYTDRISLAIGGDSEVVRAAERFKDHVCKETLTVEWSVVEAGAAGVVALKVDDLNLLLKIERVEA